MIDILWSELSGGLPDKVQLGHIGVRLLAATVLGALLGLQRQMAGKPAGLRTHLLVCLGSTVFVCAGSAGGFSPDGVSRVVQGVATGIGFIGAGAILKLSEQQQVQGLTTAASIWMTTAIGVAVGVGALGLALMGAVASWVILAVLGRFEGESIKQERQQSS